MRTQSVASLVWYPSLIIATMAVSASFVELGELGFANNVLMLVSSAILVIAAAILLRRSAEEWRSDLCKAVEEEILAEVSISGSGGPRAAQFGCLVERVRGLSKGAFAPYAQQPLVRAVLVPSLTYGATFGAQYFHLGS
jgi:hypothetical protein